jgi:uncharacterized membrane protein YfcA
MDLAGAAVLAAASVVAGAVNSVAGGGTLFSFPAAVFAGLTPLAANATNAVGLTPGVLGSAFAYRREIAEDREVLVLLGPPAIAGALAGSALLLITPQDLFDSVVPFLVLFATGLLLHQNLRPSRPIATGDRAWTLPRRRSTVAALQLAVGVYGGYFGAGMGIMMLAMMSLLGGRDIHRMNGVKVLLAAMINGVASILFVAAGAVDLPAAVLLALGSTGGGFAGASLAKRANPKSVRWAVVLIGLLVAASLGYRRLAAG